jgi:catechol 2,3-dioxygenase
MGSPEPGPHAAETAGGTGLDPRTHIGAVRLVVADLDRQREFYERTIGLRTLDGEGEVVRLGVREEAPLVELLGRPHAPPRPPRTTGLFHMAILVPSRTELALALRRVADANWSFTGASDHLVSEALYLNDPEGNGIELYRDRPRDEWPRADGQLQMATLPLDVGDLLAESPEGAPDPGMHDDTRMGHVHLNVSDLAASEPFYAGVLGFDVTVRGYPGALFVSAGGYHHHIALNTWAGEGAPPASPGSRGLAHFEVALPDPAQLADRAARLHDAGIAAEPRNEGLLTADPSGNRLLLTAS